MSKHAQNGSPQARTRNIVISVAEQTARQGKDWLRIAHEADARAATLAGTRVPLDYAATDKVRTIDYRGYAYTRTPSDISGALMTRYDESKPQVWKVPLRDDVQPALSVDAPRAGYLVPPAQAAFVAEKLKVHGVTFRTLDQALPRAGVQACPPPLPRPLR